MSVGKSKLDVPGLTLAAFLGFVQFRLIVFVLQDDYRQSVEAAMGVVLGKPHWRLYQSRVLGPYLVNLLAGGQTHYMTAYVALTLFTLMSAGYLAWLLGKTLGKDNTSALLSLVMSALSFVFLLSKPWLYVWDYLGTNIFLLFVYFVVKKKDWRWFVGLFCLAVFNRESALYIALWMIIDPVIKWRLNTRSLSAVPPFDRRMMIAGLVCFVAGVVIIELLRRLLLVEEMGPVLFPGFKPPGGFFSFQLFDNLQTISQYFLSYLSLVLFLVAVVGLCFYLAFRHTYWLGGLAFTYLLLTGSLLVFGKFEESRIYIELIPSIALGALMWSKKEQMNTDIKPSLKTDGRRTTKKTR